MSAVWLTIPSARPIAEVNRCTDLWREMGYRIALWRDQPDAVKCDLLMSGQWAGYPIAVNTLVRRVLAEDPECMWCVAAGDDTAPDPVQTADTIALQCMAHFGGLAMRGDELPSPESMTFGVMQPVGDDWSDHIGRTILRIAGSPFLGREWSRRAFQGHGPLCELYRHCFPDEELQCVAIRQGVFWQRHDLTHRHDNWARARGDRRDMPAFLAEANSPEHWKKYQALFNERKALGFPGSDPIP